MIHGRRAFLALLLTLVLTPAALHARVVGRAVRLRMEGYVGSPPEGRLEEADLSLRVGKTDVRFQVTKATVLSGGGLASEVFDRVEPYKPNFILQAPRELLERIAGAPSGSRLVITGMWMSGERNFLVGSVEPGTAPE